MAPTLSPDEALARYSVISHGLDSRVAGTTEPGWGQQSPCAEWTARGVMEHVIGVHRQMVSLLGGEAPPELTADADPAAVWPVSRQAVIDALSDSERANQVIESPFGPMPFATFAGTLLAADTLVHTWDLARATGQDEKLDPAAVAAAFDLLRPMDEMMRQPGVFDAKIEPPAGADEQTQFLAFLGRQAW